MYMYDREYPEVGWIGLQHESETSVLYKRRGGGEEGARLHRRPFLKIETPPLKDDDQR